MHANALSDFFTTGPFVGPAVAAAIIAAISAGLLKMRDDKWRRDDLARRELERIEDRNEKNNDQAKEEARKSRERQEDFHTALANKGPMGARAVVYELGAQLMLETEVALPLWNSIGLESLNELDELWDTWQVARIERRLEIYGSDTCIDGFRSFLSGHHSFRSALDDAIFILFKPDDNEAPWAHDTAFDKEQTSKEIRRDIKMAAKQMAEARNAYAMAMRRELFPEENIRVEILGDAGDKRAVSLASRIQRTHQIWRRGTSKNQAEDVT